MRWLASDHHGQGLLPITGILRGGEDRRAYLELENVLDTLEFLLEPVTGSIN